MPDETSRQQLLTRGHASARGSEKRRKHWGHLAVATFGALVAFGPPEGTHAQGAEPLHISVSATIVAQPASQASLGIKIGPPDALPKKSFVSVRGLPATVSLTDGHAIGVGFWTVPVTALAALKANIPDNVLGRSELVISLISMEGSLLAVAKTALVIVPEAIIPLAEKALPVPPPTVPAMLAPSAPLSTSHAEEVTAEPQQNRSSSVTPPSPMHASRSDRDGKSTSPPQELSPEDRRLAEKLVAQGERYLAQADVVSARLLFRRAAEKGLAAAAIRLAATYDPTELSRMQVEGISADKAEARKWYERARELGAPEAEEPLARLGAR